MSYKDMQTYWRDSEAMTQPRVDAETETDRQRNRYSTKKKTEK